MVGQSLTGSNFFVLFFGAASLSWWLNYSINGLVSLGCQVSRTNPLPVRVLQIVVVWRMSLLSQVRFVGWA